MGNPSRTSGDWWATKPAPVITSGRPGRTYGPAARQQLRTDIASQQVADEARRQEQMAMIAAIGMSNQQAGAAPQAQPVGAMPTAPRTDPWASMTPAQFQAILGNTKPGNPQPAPVNPLQAAADTAG
jgi:hypothetical protein